MALDPHNLQSGMHPQHSGAIPSEVSLPNISTDLTLDRHGRVNPHALENYLIKQVEKSKLNGVTPKDGARYGILNGTPQEWAHYFVALAKQESDFKPHHVGDIGKFKGNSNGLYQISPNDALTYHLNGDKPFTMAQLQSPLTNAGIAIQIHNTLLANTGSIQNGVGKYFGSIKHGWTPDGAEHLEAVAENRQRQIPHPHYNTHGRRRHHPSPMRHEFGVAELTANHGVNLSEHIKLARHVAPKL